MSGLIPFLKPFVKQVCDGYLFPLIKGLEDKIGSDAVKSVIEAVTADLEKEIDSVLS